MLNDDQMLVVFPGATGNRNALGRGSPWWPSPERDSCRDMYLEDCWPPFLGSRPGCSLRGILGVLNAPLRSCTRLISSALGLARCQNLVISAVCAEASQAWEPGDSAPMTWIRTKPWSHQQSSWYLPCRAHHQEGPL